MISFISLKSREYPQLIHKDYNKILSRTLNRGVITDILPIKKNSLHLLTCKERRGWNMPNKQLKMLLGWTAMHQDELEENWYLAREKQELFEIEPLK